MGVKISELNEATSVQNSDVLPIVQNGETKKVPVETLGSQKVNKTGDTMTGNLDMQSNSVKFGTDGNIQWKEDGYGDKFRIIPDFNGFGSDNKLIIQSTTGEAGEDPQNWKDLVTIYADSGASLEVRTNGLYNGLSGQKLLEIKTKTINNVPVNDYGNVDLGLSASSAMVLGVNFANEDCNSIPFINSNHWYCYVVKNQAQNVINLHTSGTVTTTVYYVEF